MSDFSPNSFQLPNAVVDDYLMDLSEYELKSLLVCFRFNTCPTDEDLSCYGIDRQIMDLALEKIGFITESRAKALIQEMASEYSEAISILWHCGNGMGGGLLDIIAQELNLSTSRLNVTPPDSYKKKRISHSLRMKVYERDKYRCVTCGTHLNLTCDHIYPESLGGETTLKNLQTMCKSCNSKKGTKVD